MTLTNAIASRLDQLLARLGELVDADPARELAPVPGDLYDPPSWPEGLPWPLSARQALDAVSSARELLTAWIAADIDAAVAALVKPEVRAAALASPELVALWRWPWLTAAIGNGAELCGPSYGPRLALGRLLRSWHADLDPVDKGIWPDSELAHRTVAEWAREPLNRLHPAMPGDALVADLDRYREIRRIPVLRKASGWLGELHRDTLALLYLVERDALADLPGNRAAAAWLTVRSWASVAPGDVHNAAATAALDAMRVAPDPVALAMPGERDPDDVPTDPAAVAMLARELHRVCCELGGLVAKVAPTLNPPAFDPQVVPERDGMLKLDADLADWLATLDQEKANDGRSAARERLASYKAGELDARHLFARWTDGRALAAVAVALWRARGAELWGRRQTVPPGVVREVNIDTLIPAMSRRLVYLPGLDDGRILDAKGRELGRISTINAEILAQSRDGLALLGSVTGHRLVRFIVHRVHDQVEAGDPYALRVDLPGGWGALAEKLRYMSRDYEPLQLLMRAGQHAEWTHTNAVIGGLWSYTYQRGNAAAPSRLTITSGEALAPGLAARLSQSGNTSNAARMARRLVPELRAEPPVSAARTNDQGAAWTLHRLALVELVDHAEELHRNGAVAIDLQRWRALAKEARLPDDTLPKLLGSWLAGDDDTPALLVEPEPGRWTLADAHKAEREFIADSGRRRSEGRENARKGKADKGKAGK